MTKLALLGPKSPHRDLGRLSGVRLEATGGLNFAGLGDAVDKAKALAAQYACPVGQHYDTTLGKCVPDAEQYGPPVPAPPASGLTANAVAAPVSAPPITVNKTFVPNLPEGIGHDLTSAAYSPDLSPEMLRLQSERAAAKIGVPQSVFDIARVNRDSAPAGDIGAYNTNNNQVSLNPSWISNGKVQQLAVPLHEALHSLEFNLTPQERDQLNQLIAANPPAPGGHHPVSTAPGTASGITDYFDALYANGGAVPPSIMQFINAKAPEVAKRIAATTPTTSGLTASAGAAPASTVTSAMSNPAVSPALLPSGIPPGPPQGNIDLNNRPVVRNGNDVSTVRSISIEEDGKQILIPTVSDDGRLLTNQEAIDQYHRTGKNLGIFPTENAANQYADALHNAQAARYTGPTIGNAPTANATTGASAQEIYGPPAPTAPQRPSILGALKHEITHPLQTLGVVAKQPMGFTATGTGIVAAPSAAEAYHNANIPAQAAGNAVQSIVPGAPGRIAGEATRQIANPINLALLPLAPEGAVGRTLLANAAMGAGSQGAKEAGAPPIVQTGAGLLAGLAPGLAENGIKGAISNITKGQAGEGAATDIPGLAESAAMTPEELKATTAASSAATRKTGTQLKAEAQSLGLSTVDKNGKALSNAKLIENLDRYKLGQTASQNAQEAAQGVQSGAAVPGASGPTDTMLTEMGHPPGATPTLPSQMAPRTPENVLPMTPRAPQDFMATPEGGLQNVTPAQGLSGEKLPPSPTRGAQGGLIPAATNVTRQIEGPQRIPLWERAGAQPTTPIVGASAAATPEELAAAQAGLRAPRASIDPNARPPLPIEGVASMDQAMQQARASLGTSSPFDTTLGEGAPPTKPPTGGLGQAGFEGIAPEPPNNNTFVQNMKSLLSAPKQIQASGDILGSSFRQNMPEWFISPDIAAKNVSRSWRSYFSDANARSIMDEIAKSPGFEPQAITAKDGSRFVIPGMKDVLGIGSDFQTPGFENVGKTTVQSAIERFPGYAQGERAYRVALVGNATDQYARDVQAALKAGIEDPSWFKYYADTAKVAAGYGDVPQKLKGFQNEFYSLRNVAARFQFFTKPLTNPGPVLRIGSGEAGAGLFSASPRGVAARNLFRFMGGETANLMILAGAAHASGLPIDVGWNPVQGDYGKVSYTDNEGNQHNIDMLGGFGSMIRASARTALTVKQRAAGETPTYDPIQEWIKFGRYKMSPIPAAAIDTTLKYMAPRIGHDFGSSFFDPSKVSNWLSFALPFFSSDQIQAVVDGTLKQPEDLGLAGANMLLQWLGLPGGLQEPFQGSSTTRSNPWRSSGVTTSSGGARTNPWR